jgi:CheY-like chemotaxis protein
MMTGLSEGRPTLLLVDDCVSQRDMYQMVLDPEFRVITAGRGLEALELTAAERPDVVVLDVMMPGMDGWETCTRIKSAPDSADTPVVLLTGNTDVDLSQHAFAVGAAAIANKPCSADRLLRIVHDALKTAPRHH